MKNSDLIVKLSSELEEALSRAAETIETYNGDALDDQTLEDAAYAARDFASEIDMSTDIVMPSSACCKALGNSISDQKITTTQDILDQHYEEVESLQRENAKLRTIILHAANDLEYVGVYTSEDDRRMLDLIGCVSRYRNSVKRDKKPLPCGDKWCQHFSECKPAEKCLYPAHADLGPRWSKKS